MDIKKFFYLFMLLIIPSCSSEKFKPSPEIITPVPISEIHERFYGSSESCLSAITEVLSSNNITIENVGSDNKFKTKPIRIKDLICNSNYSDNIPVSCSVVFMGQILSDSPMISVLRLSYEETCLDQEHISVKCKDSNAERLLFRIHREFSSK